MMYLVKKQQFYNSFEYLGKKHPVAINLHAWKLERVITSEASLILELNNAAPGSELM